MITLLQSLWKVCMVTNLDIERIIISELMHLAEPERLDVIIELSKIKFENTMYQSLFKTITQLTLDKRTVDTISIYNADKTISAVEIGNIYSEFISDAYISSHIQILKTRDYRINIRAKIDSCSNSLSTANYSDEIDELKESLIADISALSVNDKSDFVKLSDYKKMIETQMSSTNEIEGFSWGISHLDLWTSGIVIPRVYVVGGLKKSGKTRFLIHTISQLLNKKVRTAFLSLEMPPYEVTKLLIASSTGINDLRFRSSSKLDKTDLDLFKQSEINENDFGLECKSALTIEQIINRVRRYAKMGFKVITIDYLQRISHDRNKQAQELENISIRLADCARQYNVALILLSQLNALGEKEVPNMSHLKGSGGIGEAADTILLFDNLYRRTKRIADKDKIDIHLEQRHGDSGIVHLQADLGACRFSNFSGMSKLKVV